MGYFIQNMYALLITVMGFLIWTCNGMIPKYPNSDFSVFYINIVFRAKAVPYANPVSRLET